MPSDGSYLEQLSHDVLLTIGNDHIAVVVRPSKEMLSRERAMLVSLIVFKADDQRSKTCVRSGNWNEKCLTPFGPD